MHAQSALANLCSVLPFGVLRPSIFLLACYSAALSHQPLVVEEPVAICRVDVHESVAVVEKLLRRLPPADAPHEPPLLPARARRGTSKETEPNRTETGLRNARQDVVYNLKARVSITTEVLEARLQA